MHHAIVSALYIRRFYGVSTTCILPKKNVVRKFRVHCYGSGFFSFSFLTRRMIAISYAVMIAAGSWSANIGDVSMAL